MKKWNFLFMALLMSAAVMVTSCGGGDDDPIDQGPSINLKGGEAYTAKDDTIGIGQSILVGVTGLKSSVSGSKLVNYKFSLVYEFSTDVVLDSTMSTDSFNWETSLQFTGTGKAKLLFELTDKKGMKNFKEFYIVVENPGAAVNRFDNVEFGSYNDQVGSFFSSTEGITYTIGQTATVPANQVKIDFLYFYGQTNKNTFASPDDADANSITDLKLQLWPSANKNATRFNETNMTVSQFDAIGATYNFPTFDFGTQKTKANNLAVGKIFSFKTKNNKLGLVKVTYVSTTRGDKAKASIIVQK